MTESVGTFACSAPESHVNQPVLVVIGPSASGKSSVVRALHRRRLIRVHPTWTTRPPRADESKGSVEHRFVSEANFDELCGRGFFVETGSLPGLPHRYGLPPLHTSRQGRIDAVMLRAPLVPHVARIFPSLVVYQIADQRERARERLLERGSPPEELTARLGDHRREIAAGRRLADRVFFNDGCLAALVDAVAAALCSDIPGTTSDRGAS
jgi:guanylate kinase